ncbi:MAG TPA: cytochrome c oxidase subunit II [Candidatus Binatia bacterium]|nr:cytochrome c oxidase subunit II [Candidatus Binatia bacterium]
MSASPILRAAVIAACSAAVSCTGSHHMLDGAGEHARRVAELWWLMFGVLAVVYVLVCAAIVAAVVRGRRSPADLRMVAASPAQERRMIITVSATVAATAVILFAFLVATYSTSDALSSLARTPADVTIKITGQQWWWDVEYQDPVPSNTVTTANLMHIPVGRTVQLILVSADVIHSFWVPNLAGKKDLIPGHQNTMWLKAERTGRFEGLCGEFCGLQHANMRLTVVVQSEQDYQAWLQSQRLAAAEPSGDLERRGREVFVRGPCVMCHSIRGTDAAGFVAPDLTHVASRPRIGSTVPNTREHLLRWVRDSQEIKPGNRMPPLALSHEDLDAVVAYLETLK